MSVSIKRISIECRKMKPKQSQQPVRNGEKIARSQLESKVNNKNLTEARENKSDQVAIDFSFEYDWFRKWREFSGPITEQS